MTLPYFFEETIDATATHFILGEETSKHCVQVLRMRAGEQLQLTNGKGLLLTATITKEDKRRCEVNITERNFTEASQKKISIAISLLKNTNRFEWFLEKATELGVNEIIPLLCERTERHHFRYDRMRNILIAAMLQSQQALLPHLSEPKAFEEVINFSFYSSKLIAFCGEGEKRGLNDFKMDGSVQIFIGPEGDFSEREIQSTIEKNFIPVSLGNTRLRTETAGIVAAVLLVNNR